MAYQKPEDWLTKNIKVKTISEFEAGPSKSKATSITDENGDKYTIWHNVKDGSFSKAYSKFQGVKEGDVIEINYEEKPAKDPQFMNRTIRTVKKINPDGNYEMNPNGTMKPGTPVIEVDGEMPF